MKVELDETGLSLRVDSEAETEQLARAMAGVVEPGTVIGLVGNLGAGKTRLTRALAEALGVDPAVIASPTFVLIHEYRGRLPIYHFDAYRLNSAAQFEALGVDEYWQAGGLCLVEWADRVSALLPPDAWWLTIEHQGETARAIRLEFPVGQSGIGARLSSLLSGDHFDAVGI